jgi:hypothetical protein
VSEEKLKQDESDLSWIVPVGITLVWFGVVAWYLNLPHEKNGEKLYWIEKIAAQDPSNFGDFLSGAFAPVAFLWLAYSVWIQKQELVLTRKVMKEQEIALRDSSISNAQLAKETKIQNELELKKLNINLMQSLVENFYEVCVMNRSFYFYDTKGQNFGFEVAFRDNNGSFISFTCFEIAKRIWQSTENIKASDISIDIGKSNEAIEPLYRIISEIIEASTLSKINNSVFVAHGFDKVAKALEFLKGEIGIEQK